MKLPIRFSTLALLVVLAPAWCYAQPAEEKSLLINPTLQVPGTKGNRPPKGGWAGVPMGKGVFEFRNEGADMIGKATSDGVARMQFGMASIFNAQNAAPAPGTPIRASVWVRGNIKTLGEGGQGAVLQIIANGPVKGANVVLGPKQETDAKGKPKVIPTTGEIPWTKLEAVFALPENTRRIDMLMYLMNSEGEVEWKNPTLTLAPGVAPTIEFPTRFQTLQEAGAEQAPRLMAAYEKRWNEIKTRVKVPDADQLYTPNAKMSGAHPRYLFAGTPLSTMKARWKDPRFATRVATIKAQVAKTAAEPIPAQPNLDAEDPLRPYAEKLAPMALVLVLDDDVAFKKTTMESLEKWVNATLDWGLPLRDLPLSQQIFALGTVYDWLHNDLSPELKSKIRTGIIERARWMRDPANASAYMWRGTQHSANHNWFNYGALAMASAVLWGENEGLQPGETKLWMDEAIQNFTVVEAIQPKDGGTMEGYLYQDYGLRPYFDFAVLADQLTDLKHSFVDTESVRNLSSRVFSLFPGNTGFLVYGDSEPAMFSSAAQFRYIASRLKDSRAQLLAQIMEEKSKTTKDAEAEAGAWRTLFWSDSAVPAANQSELPLYHDQTDLGLYTARSSWDDNASFFGLRAGPPSGATAASLMGDGYTNGHVHPDQGNFSFYQGAANVIPGSNYARTKVTTHHNLVVFEGRDKQQGEMVGQLGGGLAWFGMTNSLGWNYGKLQKHATVTEIARKPEYHSYLADLGGVYLLTDERDPNKQFYPTYLRSLTYLTNGAVVVVDRVEVAQPRTFHFRLLTAAQDLTQNGKEWAFTVKGVPGKIVDLSPQTFERSARKEENYVWRDAKRDVAILTAKDQTKAIFVTVLGMNGAEKGIAVKADDAGVSITGAPGGPINLTWKVAPALNAAK